MLRNDTVNPKVKQGEAMAEELYKTCGRKQDSFLRTAAFCIEELEFLQEGVRKNFNTVENQVPAMVALLERNDFKVNLIQTLMFMRENDELVRKLVPKIIKDLHKSEFYLDNGKRNLSGIANRMCGIFPKEDDEEEEEQHLEGKSAPITETLSGPEAMNVSAPVEVQPPKPKKRKQDPRTVKH